MCVCVCVCLTVKLISSENIAKNDYLPKTNFHWFFRGVPKKYLQNQYYQHYNQLSHIPLKSLNSYSILRIYLCVYERERERERECVCVYVCLCLRVYLHVCMYVCMYASRLAYGVCVNVCTSYLHVFDIVVMFLRIHISSHLRLPYTTLNYGHTHTYTHICGCLYIILLQWEFFTPALADSFSLVFEWQQVSLSL